MPSHLRRAAIPLLLGAAYLGLSGSMDLSEWIALLGVVPLVCAYVWLLGRVATYALAPAWSWRLCGKTISRLGPDTARIAISLLTAVWRAPSRGGRENAPWPHLPPRLRDQPGGERGWRGFAILLNSLPPNGIVIGSGAGQKAIVSHRLVRDGDS